MIAHRKLRLTPRHEIKLFTTITLLLKEHESTVAMCAFCAPIVTTFAAPLEELTRIEFSDVLGQPLQVITRWSLDIPHN